MMITFEKLAYPAIIGLFVFIGWMITAGIRDSRSPKQPPVSVNLYISGITVAPQPGQSNQFIFELDSIKVETSKEHATAIRVE